MKLAGRDTLGMWTRLSLRCWVRGWELLLPRPFHFSLFALVGAAAQRRNDTLAFLDVVIRMVKARGVQDWRLFSSMHSEAVVALERMLIGAPARDVDHLQRVANFAFERATDEADVTLATVGIEAMSQVLRRWCRGELKGRAIVDAFEPALDVQFAKRDAREA